MGGGGEGRGGPQGKPAAQGAGGFGRPKAAPAAVSRGKWTPARGGAPRRPGGGPRLRHRVAQLTKVWPPGVPLMQKSAEIRGKMQTKA